MEKGSEAQPARMDAIDIPAGWEPALGAPLVEGRCMLVIGPTSAGKSTFCLLAANRALEAGRRPAVLDTDSGQSNVGPPTTLGAARVGKPLASWQEATPQELYFLGASSPVGHLLEAATGTLVLARRMRQAGADLLIVNTTGLVEGGLARALKGAKVALLEPSHIVSIAKGEETDGILAEAVGRKDIEVMKLKPSKRAKERNAQARRERRERQFEEYFQAAKERGLNLSEIAIWGAPLKRGERLDGTARRFVEGVLGSKVIWGEKTARGAFLVVDESPESEEARELKDSFGGETIIIARAKLEGLLAGLYDAAGKDIALGRVEEIDFAKGKIRIAAALSDTAEVAALKFGFLRIAPDGKELESLPATFWG